MSRLKICRVCLRTEAKMFKMNVYDLQWCYEEVLASKVDVDTDVLPQCFCYECATLLHKFHNFKQKCFTGQKVLNDMVMEGEISYESIYKVERKKLKLTSPLAMVQNTKVDTLFTVVDKDLQKNECIENNVGNYQKEAQRENVKEELDIEHILVDPEVFCKTEVLVKTENNIEIPIPLEDENSFDSVDDHLFIADLCAQDVTIEPKEPKNPTEVFIVADKNQDVTVKKLKARRIKETKCSRISKSKTNKKGAWKLRELIKEGNWKMTTMSEEESLQAFRAKSQCEKYSAAKYKCTDCFIFFSNNEMYTRHRLRWHTETNNPYECRFCKQRFRVNFEIKNHLKFHYNKFECLRCNLVCSRESTLLAHDAYHKGKTKKCEHCNEEFRHQSTYYTHIRTAHRSKYLCNLCGRSFVNELGMRQHKLRKHPEAQGSKETSDANKDSKTYCSVCDIQFETEEAYDEHKLHSSKHIDNNIIIPERKIKRKIPTECSQCGKQFDSQAACSKHYKNEHPNDKFVPYPELERKHVCELCGATVLYKNLKIHLTNTHEKKNACYCNICGKKFSSGGALKIHSVVHTGEKPYKCTLCDKRFTQKCSMKLHYRTFHLKEPYPKRNRNKMYDLQDSIEITTK